MTVPGGATRLIPRPTSRVLAIRTSISMRIPPALLARRPRSRPAWSAIRRTPFALTPITSLRCRNTFTDLTNSTLPSFAFIEAGYGNNDEHPGSGQSILFGQAQVANIVNSLMASPEWMSSVFFLAYDEGGGPYDHVPPVPGHSNDNTDATLGSASVANSRHLDDRGESGQLQSVRPGRAERPRSIATWLRPTPARIPAMPQPSKGFAAQLGFRVPNIIISPFTRRHYVSHTPMDHTAVIKFVESRFLGSSAHLTARDAAQPNLLEFFDFTNIPWATPPTPPTPASAQSLGYDPCTPSSFAPQSARTSQYTASTR